MKNTTRKIAISAMLIAFDVIFSRVLAFNVLWAKLGFGFAAVAVSAMLYGPEWAALTAAIGDIVGSLLFPTGAYFPGFTATAAVTGIVFGLFLYGDRPNFKRSLFAALINCVLVTLVLNTLIIVLVFEPPELMPLIWTRAFETGVMLVAQTAVIYAISVSNSLYGKILELKPQKSE